jgi:hypothetical protein
MALQTAASSMALGQRSTKIRPVMTNKKYETKKIFWEKMEKNYCVKFVQVVDD